MSRGATPQRSYAEQADGLAQLVRELRQRAEVTLQELSRRCGLAPSTISKIENGQLSPSYETLLRLADGLQIEVADLFGRKSGAAAVSGRRSITRRGEGAVHRSPQYAYEMLCADLSRKQFIPLVTRITARSLDEFPALLRHEGEEFVHVLDGAVELHTEHWEPARLDTGDSCYWDSMMGHALVALGGRDAVVLWVTSRLDGKTPLR